MVSNPGGFTDNSPISSSQYVIVKNPNPIKSLRQFLDALGIKPKTDFRKFCTDKSKSKEIRSGSLSWYSIPKSWVHSKINQ